MRLAGDSGGEIGWRLGRPDWLGTREERLAWDSGGKIGLGTREARSAWDSGGEIGRSDLYEGFDSSF